MTLTLQAAANYGRVQLYPACEQSKLLAKLAGTKTLTDGSLGLIEKLGYRITVLPPKTTFEYCFAIDGAV